MMWHKSARNILLATAFASATLWVTGWRQRRANQVIVSVTGTASIMLPLKRKRLPPALPARPT